MARVIRDLTVLPVKLVKKDLGNLTFYSTSAPVRALCGPSVNT